MSAVNQLLLKVRGLEGYRFLNDFSREEAFASLWVDLPSTIVILGPAASGKTRLAKAIAASNGFDKPLITNSLCCDRDWYAAASSPCIILDNVRPDEEGDLFPEPFMEAGILVLSERKLGTARWRQRSWSGLLIVTCNDSGVNRGKVSDSLFDDFDHSIILTSREEAK